MARVLLRRWVPLLLAAFLVPTAALAEMASRPAPVARGQVVGDLTTVHSASHRYAAYLPTDWDAERQWPVLVVLDPRGRAETAARIFAPGAERYGWVLLSSYDSRSDLPGGQDPNSPALESLVIEAERYSAAPGRLYLTGFSGTSKFAWTSGRLLGGLVAGVIGCGGALPGPWDDWKEVGFDYFGVAGTTDFNHRSMRELDELLDDTGLPHRFEYFAGAHQWLDSGLATEAIGWMELQAMKRKLRERDVVVVERLYDEGLAAAQELEERGSLFAAWRRYESIRADFEGLRPVAAPAAEAERLAALPAVAAARAELAAALAGEDLYRQRVGSVMRNIAYHADPRPLAELLTELEIAQLRSRAAPASQADRESFTAQAAERQLELVFVQAAFYVPRVLMASGAPRRAAVALQIAAAVKPQSPEIWYRLARAQAAAGESKQALQSLDKALDAGFADAARLREDPALAPVRETRGWQKIRKRLD